VNHQLHIRIAVKKLYQRQIIAYPTEGVYGLGCLPGEKHTVLRLLSLKQRSQKKGLILISDAIDKFTDLIEDKWMALLLSRADWPGPETWVVPAKQRAPKWITGGKSTLAIRITNHPIARSICASIDVPLVSTSANRANHPPACSSLAVRCIFNNKIDYILHGKIGDLAGPTPIRELISGSFVRNG
jgi:L-threonylcarbamoyladenylate synthase